MLIKTGHPNLHHGCDFLCFNLTTFSKYSENVIVVLVSTGQNKQEAVKKIEVFVVLL